jgi:glutathione S-transferase
MEILDRKLSEGPLMGGDWSVADCAVNAYLAYLPIFFPQIDLSPFPQVQATIVATQQRPAYQLVMGQR